MEPNRTFALETYARRSLNYLDRMADDFGLPYFNVFWTEPAAAAHDWPDYADVRSRQLQAAGMVRAMSGRTPALWRTWREAVLAMVEPSTGLLVRPRTPWSRPEVEMGGHALTLYAFVTDFAVSGDERLRDAARRMIAGMAPSWRTRWPTEEPQFAAGFTIKSLMAAVRTAGIEEALPFARELAQVVLEQAGLFGPDDTFRHGGHMHGNLRTLLGLYDYARYVGDAALERRVQNVFRWVNTQKTRFGFLPEVIGRRGDIVNCETCALMDWLGLAASMALAGCDELWGEIERMVRNHLVESQVADTSWLAAEPARADTAQFSWRGVGDRMRGGWAGWSSPTHILAARETLNAHWGTEELRDKTRAFQNCCGGSGPHALYIAWAVAASFEAGRLSVNLHVDRDIQEATVRCFQPWRGATTVTLKRACRVRIRLPDFVRPGEVTVAGRTGPIGCDVRGGWIDAGERPAGECLEVAYPLPVVRELVSVGNPGRRAWGYAVTWKGDSVIRMEPTGEMPAAGSSDFDLREVPVYYGREGPGPLYRREHLAAEAPGDGPAEAALETGRAPVNHWLS